MFAWLTDQGFCCNKLNGARRQAVVVVVDLLFIHQESLGHLSIRRESLTAAGIANKDLFKR